MKKILVLLLILAMMFAVPALAEDDGDFEECEDKDDCDEDDCENYYLCGGTETDCDDREDDDGDGDIDGDDDDCKTPVTPLTSVPEFGTSMIIALIAGGAIGYFIGKKKQE